MITGRKSMLKMFLITCLISAGVLLSSWLLYAAEPKWTIRIAQVQPAGHPHVLAGESFARMVEQDTKGLVEFKHYLGGTLGTLTEIIEGLQVGTHDMTVTIGRVIPLVPQLGVVDMPYLVENRVVFERIVEGTPLGDELLEMCKERGLVALAWWENGFRCVTNNVRPIRVPSDLKGIKMRTPPNEIRIRMFRTYGANPAPLSFNELFTALNQGVFDGQENPLSTIRINSFQDVQKYLSLTKHVYNPQLFMISKKLWDELPPHVQASMRNAAKKVGYEMRQNGAKMFEEDLEFLSQHMEVNEVDFEAFRKASKPVYDGFEYQDLLQRVLDVVK